MVLTLSTLHNVSIARPVQSFLVKYKCTTSYRFNTAISFGKSYLLSVCKAFAVKYLNKKITYEKK